MTEVSTENRSTWRRLASQFIWLFTARLGRALVQAGTLTFVARESDLASFGRLSAAVGIVMFVWSTADLGVSAFSITNRASPEWSGSSNADCLRLSNLTSLGAGALLVVGSIGVSLMHSEYWVFLPLAVWATAEKSTEYLLGVAVADGDTRESTRSVLSRRISSLVFLVAFFYAGLDVVLAFTLSSMISGILCYFLVRRRLIGRIDDGPPQNLKGTLRSSLPYWVNSASAQVRLLDVTVVGLVSTPAVAGIYAVPSRLTTPLRMIPTSIAQISLPYAARAERGAVSKFLAIIAGTVTLMTAVSLVLIFFSDLIIRMLGQQYLPAILPLQIVSVGLVFAGLSSTLNSLVQGTGRPKTVAVTSVVTAIGTLVFVGIGSIQAGAVGAAVGLACGFLLQTLLLIRPSIAAIGRLRSS